MLEAVVVVVVVVVSAAATVVAVLGVATTEGVRSVEPPATTAAEPAAAADDDEEAESVLGEVLTLNEGVTGGERAVCEGYLNLATLGTGVGDTRSRVWLLTVGAVL